MKSIGRSSFFFVLLQIFLSTIERQERKKKWFYVCHYSNRLTLAVKQTNHIQQIVHTAIGALILICLYSVSNTVSILLMPFRCNRSAFECSRLHTTIRSVCIAMDCCDIQLSFLWFSVFVSVFVPVMWLCSFKVYLLIVEYQ